MTDIVERLEAGVPEVGLHEDNNTELFDIEASNDTMFEAAAEIRRLREMLDRVADILTHCTVTEGVCCCGDDMDNHPSPMFCGHSPVDHGSYIASGWLDDYAAYRASEKG